MIKTQGKELIVMPRGDGTGPEGLGAMTGRGAGYCAGYDRPGYMNPAVGGRGAACGFRGGRGRGRGKGFRARRFARPAAPAARSAASSAQYADSETARKQEVNNLEQEKEMLKEELTAIENRIAELKQQQEDEE